MTDQHPITPPTELTKEWIQEASGWYDPRGQEYGQVIANRAAQWGYDQRGEVNEFKLQQARDQELEACCALLYDWGLEPLNLRAARRPKPPRLKGLALEELDSLEELFASIEVTPLLKQEVDIIRRALEALPDD
jgi:hypothetical protein